MKHEKFYRFWKRLLNGVLIISFMGAWFGLPMYVAHEAGAQSYIAPSTQICW